MTKWGYWTASPRRSVRWRTVRVRGPCRAALHSECFTAQCARRRLGPGPRSGEHACPDPASHATPWSRAMALPQPRDAPLAAGPAMAQRDVVALRRLCRRGGLLPALWLPAGIDAAAATPAARSVAAARSTEGCRGGAGDRVRAAARMLIRRTGRRSGRLLRSEPVGGVSAEGVVRDLAGRARSRQSGFRQRRQRTRKALPQRIDARAGVGRQAGETAVARLHVCPALNRSVDR